MLEPLDGENDAQGHDGTGSRPEAEVAVPYFRIANDLDGELDGEVGDDDGKQRLK